MYIDANLLFSDAQAVTAAAASTNYLDLGLASRDVGTGEDLYLVCVCDVAMTDSGSDSTLDVILYGDSTTTFTPDASQTLFQFPAASAAGTTKIAKLDPGSAPLQYRYVELYYSPNNRNLSTGSFTAFITNNVQKYQSFADGITIS
jgi:hypothetical protein